MSTTDLTLSDGRVVTIHPAKGRHLLAAMRITSDPNALALAIAAQISTVGEIPLVYEDLLDWPLGDVVALQAAITEQLGPLPTPTPGA